MLEQMSVQVLSEKRDYEYQGALLLAATDKVSEILTELRWILFFDMPE